MKKNNNKKQTDTSMSSEHEIINVVFCYICEKKLEIVQTYSG
jgi:hypothetical protein